MVKYPRPPTPPNLKDLPETMAVQHRCLFTDQDGGVTVSLYVASCMFCGVLSGKWFLGRDAVDAAVEHARRCHAN